jgi:Mrp family chromosome partitioning ATPase
LLVDGDLRAPALHKLFGLPLDSGLCEVLRSEIDVADAVQASTI